MAWCAAMTDGDLDADISPRQIGLVTTRTVVEIVRLRHMIAQQLERATIMENEYLKEIAALKKELAHYKQKDHQNQMVIDILGKAIGTRPNPGEGLDEEDAT